MKNNLLFINGHEVEKLLDAENANIINAVKLAYIAFSDGKAALPESTFLKFPNMDAERIIALPAYLGEPFHCAGIKWISSFPNNIQQGYERASALFILNSLETGHPLAVMESSIISAKRTAASALLSASLLQDKEKPINKLAIVGTGLINYESARLLLDYYPRINTICIFDLDKSRAEQFKNALAHHYNSDIVIGENISGTIKHANITTIATSATKPYIDELPDLPSSALILHTSLRDLAPEIILAANNIVDDVQHACRANTSLHLASTNASPLQFINCTIGDLLKKGKKAYISDSRPIIVNPFGLGILDLALAQFIYQKALKNNVGTLIENFLPQPWFTR